MYQLSREPQGIGKLLDSGIRLYLTGFSRVVIFSLIWSAVFAVPNFGGGGEDFLAGSQDIGVGPEIGPGRIVSFLAALLVSMFFYAAIFDRYNLIALGKPNTFIGSFIEGIVRGIPFIIYVILYSVCIAFGLVVFIVPGIWLATMFALGGNAIVIEKQGPLAAMKTSWYLVRGNWWRCTVVLTVVLLIHLLFAVALGLVIGVVVAGMFDPADPDVAGQLDTLDSAAQLLFIAMNTIIYPLWAAALTVMYHDLRLRKEGGDLASRVDDMEAADGDDDKGYY